MDDIIKFYDVNYFYNKHRTKLLQILDNNLCKGFYIRKNTLLNFEINFSRFIGVKYSYGLSSGTDALLIAIKALGLVNSNIAILNNTFVAQIEAIINTGNNPILIDCNFDNLGFLLKDLEEVITKKNISCIIISHIYGIPENINEIKRILKKNNKKIFIIEDCSHAHGTLYDNKKVGSFGDIGVFSLNPTKLLGGLCDGGIITCNNKILFNKIKLFSNHGRKGKYNHLLVGFNSRLSTLNASFLDFKLNFIEDIIVKRRKHAYLYYKILSGNNYIKLLNVNLYNNISFYVFPIFLSTKEDRDKLKKYLFINGIQTNIHYYKSISKNTIYKKFVYNKLKNSNLLSNIELSLPIGEYLSEKTIIFIATKILQFFLEKNDIGKNK